MSVTTTFVTFNNGMKYPILGLGTWKSKPGEVTQAVKDAIDAGYRHIDCAYVYQNEKEVGLGIKAKIDEGVVKREDLYVTSKLWLTHFRADLAPKCLENTLSNLGLDYLDLYLIHWPVAMKEGDEIFPMDENNKAIGGESNYLDAWKEMEKFVEQGLVKSIGISNFNSKQVDSILSIAKIKPVTNQVECHPYLNQKKLKEYCEGKGILITAYSPLGTPDRPNASKDDPVLLQDPLILQLAEKYKKTSAQIAIRYQIQKGNIVIPKSVTKSRIIENAAVFDFSLDESDFSALDSMKFQMRYCAFDMYMAVKIPLLSFNNGNKVPVLAIGTGSRFDPDLVTQAVEEAIDAGYRHIDCALIYGTEKKVGEAIRNKIAEGAVRREDLFITSKLWNTFHREDLVKIGIQMSLENLGLTYLDLFLIHWPMAYKEGEELSPKDDKNQIIPSDVSYTETWRAMEELVDEGLTKSIGVSNFNSQQIQDILDIARIKPVANQVECHPYLNQGRLKEFCEGQDILIMGYSPLGSPHRLKNGQDGLLQNTILLTLGEKYNKTVAQILIKYQVQRGVIVIPKSANKSRLISNADIFDFSLSDDDMKVIDMLDNGGRLCTGEEAKSHRYYPFNIEF
ncbi:hypothetical protein V9T40_011622 [Parthenolecanium corni]|uniref:NADP-dependent oxidoreductase domain-containing protein n=1 Tax=Parthenolecanium corni TaxID=536013 RepID=A0AAN9T7F1_9HEMI